MTCLADDQVAGRLPTERHGQGRLSRPEMWAFDPAGPFEDAEFETVDGPSSFAIQKPRQGPHARETSSGSAGEGRGGQGLAMLRPGRLRSGSLVKAIIAGTAAGAAGLALIAAWPNVFPPIATVHSSLHIEGVTTYVDPDRPDGLFFSGSVVNEGRREAEAPPLAVAVRSGGRIVARYHLGSGGHLVAAGGRFNFSGRLPTPRVEGHVVSIYFDGTEGGG